MSRGARLSILRGRVKLDSGVFLDVLKFDSSSIWLGAIVAMAIVAVAIWFFVRVRKRAGAAIPMAQTSASVREAVPESHFIEIEGVRLHYIQAGQGSDVVLLHGIGASIFIWRFLFPLLQTRHRVTAFDLAGFGKSSKLKEHDYGLDAQAKRIDQAITRLGLSSVQLVGSSMGGAISLWMAKLFPERYASVAVMAPATDASLVPAQFRYLQRYLSVGSPFLRHALNRRSMRVILGYVLARRELVTNDTIDRYLEPFRGSAEGVRTFWAATSLLADRRLPADLNDVRAKVLILYGEQDHIVPRRSIDLLVKVLPRAQVITNTSGGHHIMEDEPTWLAHQLERFFTT